MIVVGLTGSIGMGKTTAANMLRHMGIPVHDSDQAVHDLLAEGGKAHRAVAQMFPAAYDRKTKTIDRRKLGKLVFADPEKRAALEEVLHPLVQESQKDFIDAQNRAGQKMVVLDIPLLFETGAEARLDYTICMTAPAHIQAQRVLARPHMTPEKFQAILDSQMPDVEKCRRADFVVQTGLGRAYSYRELQKIVRKIHPDARNSLRHRNDRHGPC